MEQEIIQLEQRVAALTAFKARKQVAQLEYPLDINSQSTLNRGQLVLTGKTGAPLGNICTDLLCFGLGTNINGLDRFVRVSSALSVFTSSAVTDTLTNSTGAHNLKNGDAVALTNENIFTTGQLPSGLNAFTVYYVINRTGTTFQLSLTVNGTARNITDDGIGTHYWGLSIA